MPGFFNTVVLTSFSKNDSSFIIHICFPEASTFSWTIFHFLDNLSLFFQKVIYPILPGRDPDGPLKIPAEMRWVIIPNMMHDLFDRQVGGDEQPPGFLNPKLIAKLDVGFACCFLKHGAESGWFEAKPLAHLREWD
jgi:hypothetical protein